MTTINWIETGLYILVLIGLLPFVAYVLAKADLFWTLLENGDIKFIMRGETLYKIIYDIKNFKLDDEGKFVPITPAEESQKSRPWFGFYWVGIPPFASIHHFPIVKERDNPDGRTPDEWIERDKEEKVSSLRFILPRPYVIKTLELKDRTPIDVLAITKLQVVNPYTLIFLFKAKFFENAGADIRGQINDILKGFGLDEFIAADKGEVNGILKDMKDPNGEFNKKLVEQVGLLLVGISISQYDSSDPEVRKAMNAEIVARETAKGLVAQAEGYKKKLGIETEADASRIKNLGNATGERVEKIVEALKDSPESVSSGITAILEMEEATKETSKLTTFVKGGTSVVVPVGGKTP